VPILAIVICPATKRYMPNLGMAMYVTCDNCACGSTSVAQHFNCLWAKSYSNLGLNKLRTFCGWKTQKYS